MEMRLFLAACTNKTKLEQRWMRCMLISGSRSSLMELAFQCSFDHFLALLKLSTGTTSNVRGTWIAGQVGGRRQRSTSLYEFLTDIDLRPLV